MTVVFRMLRVEVGEIEVVVVVSVVVSVIVSVVVFAGDCPIGRNKNKTKQTPLFQNFQMPFSTFKEHFETIIMQIKEL